MTASPLTGITVALTDESDLFKWVVTMEGPAGSPYAVSTLPLVLRRWLLRSALLLKVYHVCFTRYLVLFLHGQLTLSPAWRGNFSLTWSRRERHQHFSSRQTFKNFWSFFVMGKYGTYRLRIDISNTNY